MYMYKNSHTHAGNALLIWAWSMQKQYTANDNDEQRKRAREWMRWSTQKRCQWVRIIRAGSVCFFIALHTEWKNNNTTQHKRPKTKRKCANKELLSQSTCRTRPNASSVLPFDFSNKYVCYSSSSSSTDNLIIFFFNYVRSNVVYYFS